MFSKQLFKRAFATKSNSICIHNVNTVNPKFPEGTVAGVYKRAVAKNELIDGVRFDA